MAVCARIFVPRLALLPLVRSYNFLVCIDLGRSHWLCLRSIWPLVTSTLRNDGHFKWNNHIFAHVHFRYRRDIAMGKEYLFREYDLKLPKDLLTLSNQCLHRFSFATTGYFIYLCRDSKYQPHLYFVYTYLGWFWCAVQSISLIAKDPEKWRQF